mmetsp:Transcript_5840/g.14431  ORF Transcript_5840/g.14431 Transcript_5840/m.14431 type:complete len:206 (+) Transcript_5840:3-620(+)
MRRWWSAVRRRAAVWGWSTMRWRAAFVRGWRSTVRWHAVWRRVSAMRGRWAAVHHWATMWRRTAIRRRGAVRGRRTMRWRASMWWRGTMRRRPRPWMSRVMPRVVLRRWPRPRRLMVLRRRASSWVVRVAPWMPWWSVRWDRLLPTPRRAHEDLVPVRVHVPERGVSVPVGQAHEEVLAHGEEPALVPIPQLLRREGAELVPAAV